MAPPEPASSWRQPVLECFTSESATASRLTVVNDPDQLFAEPVLRSLLAERGYELLARRLSGKKSARGAALSTSASLLQMEDHGLRDRQMAVIESWSEAKD